MANISKLLKTRDAFDSNASKDREALTLELQAAYNAQFDDWKDLQAALTALELSQEYGAGEIDIYRWVRFEAMPSKDDPSLEFLEAYLSERCVYTDVQNQALMSTEGDCIIINEEGDVFDGSKCIINHEDCEIMTLANGHPNCHGDLGEYSEAKAAYLIEQYMERTGCFPAVLYQNRHGDLFPRNTQELAKCYNPANYESEGDAE